MEKVIGSLSDIVSENTFTIGNTQKKSNFLYEFNTCRENLSYILSTPHTIERAKTAQAQLSEMSRLILTELPSHSKEWQWSTGEFFEMLALVLAYK